MIHKLEVKGAEIMRIDVQQEILRSEEPRYDHRLHGVLLVCSGLSCPEVAKLFGPELIHIERVWKLTRRHAPTTITSK